MEGRMKKYKEVSPERARVWTEKSPTLPDDQCMVPVVYYLCRNRQLEHPHFLEVSLSSPDGLHLRDVTEKLDVLRGRGMSSLYSWSCKRSYKNGFVWHDLCENDLILPARGNEYVLKGSELFEESNSGHFRPHQNVVTQNVKVIQELPSSRSHEDLSSPSNLNTRTMKDSPDNHRPCPLATSQDHCCHRKNYAWNSSLNLMEQKLLKNEGIADASTQTVESFGRAVTAKSTCTKGISTDDQSFEPEGSDVYENQLHLVKQTSEIRQVTPPPSTSSASSTSGRIDTLESLIRADARRFNSFRIVEQDRPRFPSSTKLKASSMLMQLISCGSISVKDHTFGLIPTYKPRFSYSKFPSPLFSTSFVLSNQPDLHPESFSPMDSQHLSRSFVVMNTSKDEERFPPFIDERRDSKLLHYMQEREEGSSIRSKCVARSIKVGSVRRQPMRSALSERPRISSERAEGVPKRSVEMENTMKIEESLFRELGL